MTSADRPARFWMVKGAGPTSCCHDTLDSAEREAARLARAFPGARFFVLEAVACHRKVDVERIDLRATDDDQELPF